uniref:Multivesicular body subunit 12Bb n=1 Tax=Cyprinus carpio TaxID=7962 RepID=A0A8C1LLB1_CYPCA
MMASAQVLACLKEGSDSTNLCVRVCKILQRPFHCRYGSCIIESHPLLEVPLLNWLIGLNSYNHYYIQNIIIIIFFIFFVWQKQLCNVVVDMKLIDLKDCLPEGFTPIQDTTDTQEQALRKERLCVKLVPRHSADMAICDVVIQGKSKHSLTNYTFIGELNGLGIWYQLGKVIKSQDTVHKTPFTSSVARILPESPASSPTKKNLVRPDYEHQIYNLYTKSAMDDIPFMIYKKSTSTSRDEYNYCFNTEHSAAAFTWTQ